MEELRKVCEESRGKLLVGSLDDWCFLKGPPPEGLIPLEDGLHKFRFRGVLGGHIFFSDEVGTLAYSFSREQKFLTGTVVAIFQQVVFLQESWRLVQIRFAEQKFTERLVENVDFTKKEFFPLSSTQLLRIEVSGISLYVEGNYGFKRTWEIKRDERLEGYIPHSAKITGRSVLYIEASPRDYRYRYFSLVDGQQTGPATIPTPHIWPLPNGRFLSLVKALRSFFLEIHYPDKTKKVLQQWQTFDECAKVKWIDSNSDWGLVQMGDKIAAIRITPNQECLVGTFDSPNGGLLYARDQVLLYSRHTLLIYHLPTLKHVHSIVLTTESYYPEMDDFLIQEVRIASEGCVVLAEGYAEGKAVCRYLKRVDMSQKATGIVSSDIKQAPALLPSIPQEKKPFQQKVKTHLLPSGGIAVTSPDHLVSYSVEGKVILSLPCKPLEVAGDWALVQVDKQLQMQCLSKFEQRRYLLPPFSFGATIIDDSLLIAGGGHITLYDENGKEKGRYEGPQESVVKAYASQDRLYLMTQGTQADLFWMHVYRQQDYQFLERFYLSHIEVCRVGDDILGVQKQGNESQYFLKSVKGSCGIAFPYGKDFKWLGEDGTWAVATCDGKLHLMKGTSPSEHHVLGGSEGASLLGKGLLAIWNGKEVEISKIGDFKALRKVSTKHSIRGVLVRDANLLCVTQREDLSFETECFSLTLPLDTQSQKRPPTTSSQKSTLVALAAIALFTYYYLQRQAKKLNPPPTPTPLNSPPKPSTPPRRIPVRIRPPRQNVWGN